MIPTNELRIGNWVLDKESGNAFPVISVDKGGVLSAIGYGVMFTRLAVDIEPIPLTPGVLDKCGFTSLVAEEANEIFDTWYMCGQKILWQHDNGFCSYFMDEIDLTSLHQLMNLYFALTNTELTYDPHNP